MNEPDREGVITDPERVVIVVEYEANPYDEQWFKDVVTNLLTVMGCSITHAGSTATGS